MLAYTPTKNDHAGFPRLPGHFIEVTDVANDVEDEAGGSERMEVDHISYRSVSQRWTENWYVVLQGCSESHRGGEVEKPFIHFVSPVIHGLFVINLLS